MDIEIFPHRILGTDTTEKVLNDIESLDSVKRTVIQGPRLPPQDEIDRIYGDRRIIVVNGEEVDSRTETNASPVPKLEITSFVSNSGFGLNVSAAVFTAFCSLGV